MKAENIGILSSHRLRQNTFQNETWMAIYTHAVPNKAAKFDSGRRMH